MGPLLFTPYLRPLVWGGRRLGERLGKVLLDEQLYGESWEVSDHASHSSVVAVGPLTGTTLRELMTRHRKELLGEAAARYDVFPWLVKLLDAHDWLSVQVHPSDALVKKWLPNEGGKTEAWFVLDVLPGSRVYAGLLPGVDEKTLRAAVAKGTVAECLHSFEPKPGDCVFLPAGTVHAVGGGVLFLEVQQTSDATFRLFDWNRVDAQGKGRALHIEEAMACINWRQGPVEPVHARAMAESKLPMKPQPLASCEYFRLEIRGENGQFAVGGANTLQLFIPVHGEGVLSTEYGRQPLLPGQAWVLPAATGSITGKADPSLAFLSCTLPNSRA